MEKDSREKIKTDVIAWVKLEIPTAPMFQQKAIVAEVLKVVKSRSEWNLEEISAGRRAAVKAFMIRFSAVLDAESIDDEATLTLLEEFEGLLGSDALDSSGLPCLEGSHKAVEYAFSLRSDWFGRLSSRDLESAKKEILENKTASYWISKLKN